MIIRPRLSRTATHILLESGYNEGFVAAIKEVIPKGYREYRGGIWKVDVRYYSAIRTLCDHFFGSKYINSVGGVSEPQISGWIERWQAFKSTDRKRAEFESQIPLKKEASLDAYSTLYVTPNAPKEVIRAAYRTLASLHHPDNGGDNELMARINAAYTQLKSKGVV